MALALDEPRRNALEARPPEGAHAGPLEGGAKGRGADPEQLRERVSGQDSCEFAHETVEGGMDEAAALGGSRIRIERFERLETKDVTRVDPVGIAHPGLDLGDRETTRTGGQGRARCGRC